MTTAADEIALEHVLWAAQDGQRPEEVLEALGYPPIKPSWDTVLLALRIAWRKLPRAKRARRKVTAAQAIELARIELKRAA